MDEETTNITEQVLREIEEKGGAKYSLLVRSLVAKIRSLESQLDECDQAVIDAETELERYKS